MPGKSRLDSNCHRQPPLPRRECLRIGSLGLFGLSAVDLVRWRALADGHVPPAKHQRNSCVFIFLFGGPSHIDLWDMKPEAPAEIRGEFRPIATNVPGVEICEHLPHLARQMDKVCLLRSMTHKMSVHGPACSEIYTGREYFGPPVTDQATPEDWPSLSAMVTRFGSSSTGLPPAAVLPWYTQFVGQDRRIAGQTGGRMGDQWNPFLIQGDPSRRDFEVQGVYLPDHISRERFRRRQELFGELDRMQRLTSAASRSTSLFDRHRAAATDMIEKSQGTAAFDVAREPQRIRQSYGPTKFGQSLLLARRLIENGMPLVTDRKSVV